MQKIKQSNEWSKKYYDSYIAKGDFESAESFKPIELTRFYNPADFELSNFEEFEHNLVPSKWYSLLMKFGKFAFEKLLSELNVDKEYFEFGINSTKDWCDKTWNISNLDLA